MKGPDSDETFEFEREGRVEGHADHRGWRFEYYGATGAVTDFDPWRDQRHMIFPTIDFEVSPDWELNFGVGRGITDASQRWVTKSIIGYQFKH